MKINFPFNNIHFLVILYFNLVYSEILERRFGTRTPYRAVQSDDQQILKDTGCTPERSWFFYRHGTRLPNAEILIGMKKTLPGLKNEILASKIGNLSEDEIEAFGNWEPLSSPPEDEKLLTVEGELEMLRLGENFRKYFNDLVPKTYHNSSVKIRFTPSQRTIESAKYFGIGLFDDIIVNNTDYPAPVDKCDPVLRFYKNCTYWKNHIKKNITTYKEFNAYLRSDDMRLAMKNMTNKLGLSKQLGYENAILIYKTCSFETAMNRHSISPWCSAFTDDSIKVFESLYDIKYYWAEGYGNIINGEIACNAINDMVDFIKAPNGQKSAFYFSHSGAMLKILAYLNLYKPKQPLNHDYVDPGRAYRMSLIDSFASNLGFVLLKCEDGQKVLTLHQERPVGLPFCDDRVMCPLDEFLNVFEKRLTTCDLHKLCADPQKVHDEL